MAAATCWLIRAGEESRHADDFAHARVVALGWPDVPGVGDLRGVEHAELRAVLAKHSALSSPDQDAAELLAFRDDVDLGDIVITPDAKNRDVLIGTVMSDYDYRDPSPAGDYRHVRDVEWHGRWERDLLPDDLRKQTYYRRTIRRLDDQEVWRGIAERVRAGEGRRVTARSRGALSRRRSLRSSTAGSSARACPGCGLSKVSTQFVAGNDLCVDCR
jgi:predicted Mrr-cat superfamily restriction endonuclease